MTTVAPMIQQPGYPPSQPMQPGYQVAQPGYQVAQPGYPAPAPGPHGAAPPPYQHPQAITTQPGGVGDGDLWMVPPQAPAGCPPGLEYMTQIDQLLVKQKKEMMELVTGFETNNKYKIKNSLGQTVYMAIEDTGCCMRNCCGPNREFNMKILDNSKNEVVHLYRPYRCGTCCTPCHLNEIEVHAPPGTIIGYVTQTWSFCTPVFSPQFDILDGNRNPILKMVGPDCTVECCSDMEFKVLALDGFTEVGRVVKQWGGFIKEAFTDADTFGITFPMDLDVKAKATMLGAVMLIDFMFFEKQQNNHHHH